MKTVSDYRVEKRVLEIQRENRITKLNKQRILHTRAAIEREKESILQALDCNFFDMAKTKIERVRQLKKKELLLIGLSN